MIKQLMVKFFGPYTPNYLSGNLTVIPDGLAGVDFVWIGQVILFLLFLYLALTFIRAFFNRR